MVKFADRNGSRLMKWWGTAGLVVFVSFLIFSSLFLHIHKLPDGQLVVHSHLVQKSSSASSDQAHPHRHNSREYLFHHYISQGSFILTALWVYLFILLLATTVFDSGKEVVRPLVRYPHQSRAPPTFRLH